MTVNRTRNVALVLSGVALFLLKPSYHGPFAAVVHDYGGNFTISFALYFLAVIAAVRWGRGRLAAALAVLLVVEAFEVADGFGVMANVYDPVDLGANAAGIGAALGLDVWLSRLGRAAALPG